ncbi:HAMP domain-containing histidine kinase [Streptomyces sp. F63]|uniref:sensor histidine kinase n=1 Tax=Streptomyces sp. F63 TaxID=2824887 RepID=UPI001B38776D|nr:HAMP domain-containing sensor histidine kinase [Streptomyces sp. F63]MBQ0984050.1 HAMP domain-containing histidine kinase [Streptomyces sp. F63]
MFRSVRAKAALGATLVVAVALVSAGAAVLWVLRDNLLGRAELEARLAAREIASQVAAGRAYGSLELPDRGQPVQVVDEDGRLRAASEGLEAVTGTGSARVTPEPGPSPTGDDDHDDDDDDPGSGRVSERTGTGSGTATVDGETAAYRFASVEATTPRGETVTVHAGVPLATEQAAVGTVRTAMLAGLPALLAVVAAATWLTTRRALRPVEGIRREMAAITASADLSRRVPVAGSGDEVERLARTTNETLGALESAVERQRKFVADASHELRSPIASLRTQLEVGEAHPELLDVAGAVADTVRLQALAADLLLLARLDAGERPPETAVDLGALLREETAQRRDGLPVRVTVESECEVTGSRGRLAQVLGNLLDNAQRHARREVAVSLRRDGAWAVLEVSDDGPGVPADQRERIFERFVRLDEARSRDDGGAGLGLAIARDIAVRHGGTLVAAGGAVFRLRLPLAGRS